MFLIILFTPETVDTVDTDVDNGDFWEINIVWKGLVMLKNLGLVKISDLLFLLSLFKRQ